MPPHRKLRALKIFEISAVDRPAQEGARMVLMKRDPKAGATTKNEPAGDVAAPPVVIDAAALAAVLATEAGRAAIQAALEPPPTQETAMTTDADRIKTLEAELAKAQTLASMTDIEKAHHRALTGDDQRVYLAKSATERKSEAEARFAPVYKSATGEVYTLADDPRLVEMAKRADQDRAEAEQTRLEKRADTILKHTGKSTRVRAAMLKALDGIADDTLRKEAHEALVAGDHAMSGAYEVRGFSGGEPDENSAAAQLTKMAADRAAKSGETIAKATVWLLEHEPKALDLKKRADAERKAAQRARA